MADQLNVNTGTAAGTRTWRDLLVSGHNFLTRRLTLESPYTCSEGQILAKRTSSTKLVPYEGGAGGGDGTAYCIAVQAGDASGGDDVIEVYTMGVFNKNKIVLGDTGDTADSETLYDDLRTVGIHLVDSVGG